MKHFKIKNFRRINLIVSDWIRVKRWLRSGPIYNYQEFDYIKEKLNFDRKNYPNRPPPSSRSIHVLL